MNYHKTHEITTTRYFRLSAVASVVFHLFILVFLIALPLQNNEGPRQIKTHNIIQASLIVEKAGTSKKIAPILSEVKSAHASKIAQITLPVKSAIVSPKKHLIVTRKIIAHSVKSYGKTSLAISKESLQTDMSRVAENIAFGTLANESRKEKIFSSSAYRHYVDACRDKLVRIGSRYGDAHGTAILHLTIRKDGTVTKRHVESSDSPELKISALRVIDEASPFSPFPNDLKNTTIAIAVPAHFVTK